MQDEKFVGTVCWFDSKMGYGFISRQNEPDLFIHWSDIVEENKDDNKKRSFKTLKKGQEVVFSIGLNNRKQPKAIEVIAVSDMEKI